MDIILDQQYCLIFFIYNINFIYVQWITTVAIYERYINNCIQQFVDVCSLANISVFILSAEFFGYYIHGRYERVCTTYTNNTLYYYYISVWMKITNCYYDKFDHIWFVYRSAHGFSDTDMESLIGQLRREEDNMVRHRGLMPGTENQTFEMTVPSSLKTYYRRVMAPLNSVNTYRTTYLLPTYKKCVFDYNSLNHSFIFRSNPNRFPARRSGLKK